MLIIGIVLFVGFVFACGYWFGATEKFNKPYQEIAEAVKKQGVVLSPLAKPAGIRHCCGVGFLDDASYAFHISQHLES